MQSETVPQGLAGDARRPRAGCGARRPGSARSPTATWSAELLQAWRRCAHTSTPTNWPQWPRSGTVTRRTAVVDHPAAGAGPGRRMEIAVALVTELTACREHALAEMLVHRHPPYTPPLAAGDIDKGRAAVFADLLEPLTDAQNARIVADLLPKASGWTADDYGPGCSVG
ncbi:hypothetical protein HBB16_18050 [Pseudonocardia sp. MCCB 268]|nr:hypothetical protein [Pseudonocardia cytotoxica]